MITKDDEKKIKEIIIEELNKIFRKKNILSEMAVERSTYLQKCISNSQVVLTHLAKICLFENNQRFVNTVNHWKSEIFTEINSLFNIKVKKDNNRFDIAKRAFSVGFIESTLGEDFEDYNDILPYFIDAAYDEGEAPDKEKCLKCAIDNKDRICTFLYRVEDILSIGDKIEQHQELLSLVNEF